MVRPEFQMLLAGASSLLALGGMSDGSYFGAPAHRAVAASPVAGMAGVTQLFREADGLFYLDGRVNGGTVRFLVDTGANVTVLTHEDAQRLRLAQDGSRGLRRLRTVGGPALSGWTKAEQFDLGERSFRNVDLLVVRDDMPVSLLGQDMLSRMGPVLIDGDRLIITDGGGTR